MSEVDVLCIAPHPDDETLGAGGLLLRAQAAGLRIGWLIATEELRALPSRPGFHAARSLEIEAVARRYGFTSTTRLGLASTSLANRPIGEVISALSPPISELSPALVLSPSASDIHGDHRAVATAVEAIARGGRSSMPDCVLAYEVASQTGAGFPQPAPFRPDLYLDIDGFLDEKLDILSLYHGETPPVPHGRSLEAVRARAILRGSESYLSAAEAFQILRLRLSPQIGTIFGLLTAYQKNQ